MRQVIILVLTSYGNSTLTLSSENYIREFYTDHWFLKDREILIRFSINSNQQFMHIIGGYCKTYCSILIIHSFNCIWNRKRIQLFFNLEDERFASRRRFISESSERAGSAKGRIANILFNRLLLRSDWRIMCQWKVFNLF